MIGSDPASIPNRLHHLRRPLGFHFRPQRLKRWRRCRMHDPRAWLRRWRVRTFRRRRDQRLDELVSEADDLVLAHVATDHAVGQPWLERLIDDASFIREIRFALSHELAERHGPRARCRGARAESEQCGVLCIGQQFDLPHALPAIAAVLLEYARACRFEAAAETLRETPRRCDTDGYRCPSRDVWCGKELPSRPFSGSRRGGRSPTRHAKRRRATARRAHPVLPIGDWIDPDEHAVGTEKLPAHFIDDVVGIDRGLGLDAERG